MRNFRRKLTSFGLLALALFPVPNERDCPCLQLIGECKSAMMVPVESFREFVSERLTAAAEEIFRVFQRTVVEYEEEIGRQRRLLEVVWKPHIQAQRIGEAGFNGSFSLWQFIFSRCLTRAQKAQVVARVSRDRFCIRFRDWPIRGTAKLTAAAHFSAVLSDQRPIKLLHKTKSSLGSSSTALHPQIQ